MHTRRKFISILAVAAAALTLPLDAFASPFVDLKKRVHGLSLQQIFAVSWEPAKHEIINYHGRGTQWTWPTLQQMEREGRIEFVDFGATYQGYEIEQVCIPVTWTINDEERNSTESQRIALAASMCENAVFSHDYYLGGKIPDGGRLLVSKTYFRDKGETIRIPNKHAYYFTVITAVVVLDKDGNQVRLRPAYDDYIVLDEDIHPEA